MNRITALILVAVISILGTAFVIRMLDDKAAACDVHPQLTGAQMNTMRANINRARAQAYNMVINEGKDKDAANRVAEDAAFDTFAHDLRDALSDEYLRHRRSLDGCF